MGKRGLRRLPMTALVSVCAVLIGVAVSGGASPLPGLELSQAGHWIASPALNLVLFVNGSAKSVDAQVPVAGLEPGSQVVQGPTSGYVIGKSTIVEFGKSNLSVDRTLPSPSGERPALVEASGGPYLVYREAGRVVRLGSGFTTLPAGGPLGTPVATPDGTLWLNRTDSGALCRLAKDADTVACRDNLGAGHTGALSIAGDRAVFVDTTTDTIRQVSGDRPGEPVAIGKDLSPAAQIAPADADGRIAVLEQEKRQLSLLDAGVLEAGRAPGQPIKVDLPDGIYSKPTASASSVVLLDLTRHHVVTYGADGNRRQTTAIPPESGTPQLVRGDDKRVYVDGGEGKHVLVVDPDGKVSQVPVAADKAPAPATSPQPPPTQPPPAQQPPKAKPDVRADGPKQQPPPARKADPPVTQQQKPLPPSPPGIPARLTARLQGSDARVTWGAAADNRAAVTAYHVTWKPSSGAGAGFADLAGTARSTVIPGLRAGITYTVTVVAENSAGRGTPATAKVTGPAIPKPTITVTRGKTGTYEPDPAECSAPDCAKMHVVVRGFAPNTEYHFTPHCGCTYSNEGRSFTTDANGAVTFEAFDFGAVGKQAWVTADNGVSSPKYTWPPD
ncbi:fibronectin type III domain-containing protein [Amycolatopsis sp. NPDC051045]|uniref:fibronectin type III domain-containing protein n=1 Tax=Amycolatopsis sp. NPDC051045 TaxID=3156922 RepID=UPI00343206A6